MKEKLATLNTKATEHSSVELSIERVENVPSKLLYYTGLQHSEIFNYLFNFLLPSGKLNDLKIFTSNLTYKTRSTKLSAKNQLFLTLIKLRRGLHYETLGDIFGVSKSSINKIFISWINLMYLKLGSLNLWPHRNVVLENTPAEIKEKYPKMIALTALNSVFNSPHP